MEASDSLPEFREWIFFIPFPFPNFWNGFFSFPSRSRISGMDFFHSLPVPEFREWIFFIPFPFPNFGNGFFPFPSRSRISGMDFFHSLPVPELTLSKSGIKREIHLYTRCYRIDEYWTESRLWYFTILGCKPPLRTSGPKIFGFEAEPWNSLENIFYRSVRYAVFKARHTRTPPDLTTLRGLVFDELERKYSHNRHLRYEESGSNILVPASEERAT